MYAEAGLQLPAFPQEFLQEIAGSNDHSHHFQHPLSDDDSLIQFHGGLTDCGFNLGNMVQAPVISEYVMGEGDLFKAPETILEEEPLLELDPVAAAMSIISNGDDVTVETIKIASGIESIQDSHANVLYEYKKDLLEESEIEDSISELLRVNIPTMQIDEEPTLEKLCPAEGSMQKSVSSGCLNSVEWIPCCSTMRDFLDLQGLDIVAALGLRRAYSEGDIQNLGSTNTNTGNTIAVCSSFEQLLTISDLKTEQRQQKLTRYREKKNKRNFVRKIKYACRKALADSQPRVRGRFAKTEESETFKPNMVLRNTELGEIKQTFSRLGSSHSCYGA